MGRTEIVWRNMMEAYKRKIVYLHPIYLNGDKNKVVEKIKDEFRLQNNESCNVEFEWSMEKPEYIIATELIYVDRKIAKLFFDLVEKNPNAILIFIGYEFVSPDMNIFDYALSFDRNCKMQDRIVKVPTIYHFAGYMLETKNQMSYEEALKEYEKRKFCNFIYSNSNAHPVRDQIFYALERYKRVDSLGGHLNNMGNTITRYEKDWGYQSINMKAQYRFSISAGNAIGSGNTDEKLLTSFQAHSIPIFWGDPDVEDEFNPDAFINVGKFSTLEDLVFEVSRIDQDPHLWSKMVSAPWQTPEQEREKIKEEERYTEFWLNVFCQDISKAHRAPQGTFTSVYQKVYYGMLKKCVGRSGIIEQLRERCHHLKTRRR